MATIDKDGITSAYNSVRDDNDPINWAVLKYEDKAIVCTATGTDFDALKQQLNDGDRGFVYLRVETGDELSKRKKFVFLTWIGNEVSVLQRAKAGTDKANIKQIITSFAVEMQTSDMSEVNEEAISAQVRRAGGANYGTGTGS